MFHDDEVPLRSAKKMVRQLRAASDRLCRNDFLSSMYTTDSNDAEMIVDYTDSTDDKNDGSDSRMLLDQYDALYDRMVLEENDDEVENSSVAYSDAVVDAPVDDSYLNNSNDTNSNDDENNSAANDVTHGPPGKKDIATALALFRHRHKLSKSCINDLCDLLRLFGVINVPSDFRSIEKILMKNEENILQGQSYIVCSQCGNKGTSLTNCDSVQCKSNTGFMLTPTTLCTFKLFPQIKSILERHNTIPEPDGTTSATSDIQEGERWNNLEEVQPFDLDYLYGD
ncbi:unnamed protein product [Rotaria sordida]|uniref:Uncharacterized protein n=1 Tax=Rotaria sordida TaxID=392033 RepID=A0A815P3P1_9BILA|nr:unnamed protein product [Rotaria sordida]CAF4032202.1 unnamed protein product [Rotaria sordida]